MFQDACFKASMMEVSRMAGCPDWVQRASTVGVSTLRFSPKSSVAPGTFKPVSTIITMSGPFRRDPFNRTVGNSPS